MSTLKDSKSKTWKEQSLPEVGDWRVKGGLAQMLKGGVIMDVVGYGLDYEGKYRELPFLGVLS